MQAADGDGARRVLSRYCEAWNRGDLAALFALFSADAVYHGLRGRLEGRDAIRAMYEVTFRRGDARGLIAEVVTLRDGTPAVALWRRAPAGGRELVAVKRFSIRDGLIREHDLREGPDAASVLGPG